MNIQANVAKYPNQNLHKNVNFGNTVNPSTVAEKFQQELRGLYHNVSTNEHFQDGVYPRTARTARYLIKMLEAEGFESASAFGEALRLKLRTLYRTAASDGSQNISVGWANATTARIKFADMITSKKWLDNQSRDKSPVKRIFHTLTANFFNKTVKEAKAISDALRNPVKDNLPGDY